MELIFNNKSYEILFYESENRWIAQKNININNLDLSFEIPLQSFYQDLNWESVSDFLTYIELDIINNLNPQLEKILSEVAEKSNWLLKSEIISKFRFELKGIEYREPVNPIYSFDQIKYNYSFLYGLFHSEYVEEYDPYTRYFIDLRGNSIVGYRKEI